MGIELIIPAIVFYLTWMVGLELRCADITREINGRSLLAIAASLLILPAIGLLIVTALPMPPAAASGILLITLCPAGGASNVYALYARADVALSVVATGISSMAAFVLLPLWLRLCEYGSLPLVSGGVPYEKMAIQLFVTMLLPVALGIAFNHCWPATALRLKKHLLWIGIPALALLITIVMIQSWSHVAALWGWATLLTVIVTVAGAAAGMGVSVLCRLDHRQQLTMGIEYPVRHLGIAVLIAMNVLNRPEFAGFAAVVILVQFPLMFMITWLAPRPAKSTPDPQAIQSAD